MSDSPSRPSGAAPEAFEERLETVEERFRTGIECSTLARGWRTLARYIRHSWCYRWLTKEPEPEVIVIDLRETYTVGPVIRLLDRCLEAVARALPSSKTAAYARDLEDRFRHRPLRVAGVALLGAVFVSVVGTVVLGRLDAVGLAVRAVLAGLSVAGLRSERTLEDLTETRAWELLVAAFEPPEPPESRDVSAEGLESPVEEVTEDERDTPATAIEGPESPAAAGAGSESEPSTTGTGELETSADGAADSDSSAGEVESDEALEPEEGK